MNNTIGIDISKDTLDVHRLMDGQHKQFLNGKSGHAQLLKWIGTQLTPLIIFEATGAYHRGLEQALGAKDILFVKVNPKQARRFAQASGRLAKTDRVDCEMLAKMGVALQLAPTPLAQKACMILESYCLHGGRLSKIVQPQKHAKPLQFILW